MITFHSLADADENKVQGVMLLFWLTIAVAVMQIIMVSTMSCGDGPNTFLPDPIYRYVSLRAFQGF